MTDERRDPSMPGPADAPSAADAPGAAGGPSGSDAPSPADAVTSQAPAPPAGDGQPGATDAPPPAPTSPDGPVRPPEPRAAADDAVRPAEPISEASLAVTDKEGFSASEAAAEKRAETMASVALVAAIAEQRASQAALAAATATPVVEEAPRKPGKIRALRAFGAMLVRGIAVLALFVGGLALGNAAFQNSQPQTPTQVVDPATDGAEPPAVVREFVGALSSGDADALRSSLQAEPHARLTSEFRRFDIQQVTSVETLSTHVDGTRSATEIVMQGTTTTGTPISINLVVLADGNTIEGFR